jgi:bile acid-coenzyme A ligase
LKHWAGSRPREVAVICEARQRTWSAFDIQTTQLAIGLRGRGVAEGDIVTIVLADPLQVLEVSWGCWKLGATPQVVSSRLTAPELQTLLEIGCPKLLVSTQAPIANRVDYLDLAGAAGGNDPLPEVVSPIWKAPTSGGSTGRPKIILSTEPAITNDRRAESYRLGSDETALMPAPLYHNGPFSNSTLATIAGAKLVLMPRFDPEAVLRQIEAHRVTWLYLVPTMMSRILQLPLEVRARYDISSLKTLWHMAAPCPVWLKEAWIEWVGPEKVMEMYGGTERQAVAVISGAESLSHPGSVGRVTDGEMLAIKEDGQPAAPREVGEIFMRPHPGAPRTYTYIGAEARSIGDGWESLGDMGWFDEDGYLYLADRRADMILVGGANVYPAEVEAALDRHPRVISSAVIGLPDVDLGSRIHAIVHTHAGFEISDLRDFLSQNLVPYKRPHTIEVVDFPLRDDAGKSRRFQLRQERIGAAETDERRA